MRDLQKRSLVKTMSWRMLATLTTILLVYFFTGKPIIAASVGFLEVFVKMMLYYFHERIWEAVEWGRADQCSK